MTHLKIVFLTRLKSILPLLLIAALLMISPISLAAGGGGPTPDKAVSIVGDEVYISNLEPGEQQWFKFTEEAEGQATRIERSLGIIFTPNEPLTARFVSLKIFEEEQLSFYFEGDTSNMTHLGAGQTILRDDNPETGELFWTGWVLTQETYYVVVQNDSDFPIDYRLFSEDISSPPPLLGEPETPQTEPEASVAEAEESASEEPLFFSPTPGVDPVNPAPLPKGTFQGKLQPNTIDWYSFSYPDFSGGSKIQELDFSVFFTPDDGHRRHHVNFELYAAREVDLWRRGDAGLMRNFGAGMQVSRDGDYNTAERIWRGVVLKDDTYLLAVENGTDVEIDYWVFDGDIYNPILGPLPAPAPVQVFAPGAAPQSAVPLKLGLNKASLEPGQENWYSFSITDFDNESREEMALTMITTPDDGNLIRQRTFDVFTAGGARDWSPGDNTRIDNFGAGSVVYRDDNPLTGERFWHGWIIDNDLYLVQVRNGTDQKMDYWLYTGDVYRPELGEKSVPVARATAALGTAPTNPVELSVGINKGRLQPGAEQWYTFSRGDVDNSGAVDTTFTMIFTPDDGNRIRKVNLELFEGNQLRDWARTTASI